MNCDNVFSCAFSLFPSQGTLLIIGLAFLVIGVLVYSVKGTIKLDLGPFKDLTIPKISKFFGLVFLIAGGLFVLGGMFWFLIASQGKSLANSNASQVQGSVSLVSMKYASGGWNPHQVDLRTATSSGIPAGATFPLQFTEITVFAPPELAGFKVWAEFLANGIEKIGETPVAILQPGLTSLDSVKIVDVYRFQGGNTGKYSKEAWDVQKSWATIDIKLHYQGPAGQEGITNWNIKLDQMSGTAWWNSPPDVNLVAVVYSVSDGVQQVLDLRRESRPVINAKAGDWITIHSVWYKANSNNVNNLSMFIGGSLNDGRQELENKSTDMAVIREGIHQFENFKPMTWVLTSETKLIGLIAIRSDDTVLDGYVIEISDTEQAGLVSTQKSVVWPFERVQYLDFETPADLDGWVSNIPNTFAQSTKESFSGGHSLAVTLITDQTQAFISRDRPFQAEVLLGQVYWPKQDGIEVEWAQACLGSGMVCVPVSKEPGRWNTFVMDFSEIIFEKKFLNEVELPSFFIQGKVVGASSDKPYTFYVDGIQIYPVTKP